MVTLATSSARQDHRPKLRDTSVPTPNEHKLKHLRFELASSLQATLELTTTLDVFYHQIQSLISLSGLQYCNPGLAINEQLGHKAKHQATYTISTAGEDLGKICFRRATMFLEPELATLETLIGILFYPLRNALLYRQALQNSVRDTLTGIGNRAAMDQAFGREIKLAKRQAHPLSLLIIDIDFFKQINDQYGHARGDQTLINVAEQIQSSLRETDQVFRYGGEEFVALLNGTGMASAQVTAERIRLNVANTIVLKQHQDVRCTVSIGASALNVDDDCESLFERADKMLYQAKNSGRNRVCISPDDSKREIKPRCCGH